MKRQQLITKWDCQHVKRYPTAQHKRIYARKVTITITPKTKAQETLERILQD